MKKVLLLSFLIACATYSFADFFTEKRPKVCNVVKPSVLNKSLLRQSDIDHLLASPDYCQSESANSDKRFWIVYSDRDMNFTYTTSSGSIIEDTLYMNEKLRIATIDYKTKRALVYSERIPDIKYPRISDPGESYKGWIPMDNLLLWQTCIANEVGVYQKALLCLNADKDQKNNEENRGYQFKSPTLVGKEEMDPIFRFYYIMKEAKGKDGRKMVLLATQSDMYGDSEKNLHAWVTEDMYAAWNQRSCLETTWDKEAVHYFAKEKYVAKIFDTKNRLAYTDTFKINRKDPNPDNLDDDFYRWPSSAMRYPILDGTNLDKYQCTAFQGNVGGGFVDPSKEIASKELAELKQINILVLLDATRSMDEYSEAVYDAIRAGCAYFASDKYKVQVGVMLYRDDEDGRYETEWSPFTNPTNPTLMNFIKNGGRNYGFKSAPEDITMEESLYYGMNKALQQFTNPKQSNILLVVGDCGNNPTDTRVSNEQLIAEIKRKEVNVIGFQVRTPVDPHFSCFNDQMSGIIRNSLQARYDKIRRGSKVTTTINEYGFVFSNIEDPDAILCMGEHCHAFRGTNLKPADLTEMMQKTIGSYADNVQEKIDALIHWKPKSKKINVGSDIVKENGGLVGDWLEEIFGPYADVTGLIGFTGYTDKVVDDRAVWRSNVFFTEKELKNLIAGLEPLYDVAMRDDYSNRNAFVTAFKRCVENMAPGVNINDGNLSDMMQRAMGLHEKTFMLEQNLDAITDNQAVEDDIYGAILTRFKRKYEIFKEMVDSREYKYKWEHNGQTYYWIAIDDMP